MAAEACGMPSATPDRYKSQWPMSYVLIPQPKASVPRKFWQHDHYRGPAGQKVEVKYSKTKKDSEALAQLFLNEPIVGFDMEWPWNADKRSRLQDKVALIQLACEHTIALFHIALHTGKTTQDLIAPSLRTIIENPKILKTGVCVLDVDFRRLRDYFRLKPQGAFELSHLRNLVVFGASQPERCTTRLYALSKQVDEHLGLPLWKGSARTSDWSKPLNPRQVNYAATDAYAGFMLFHRMNAKRIVMDPRPPLPRIAETYLPFKKAPIMPIQMESVADDGKARVVTSAEFFGVAATSGRNPEDIRSKKEIANPTSASNNEVRMETEKNRHTGNARRDGTVESTLGSNTRTNPPSNSKSSLQPRSRKEREAVPVSMEGEHTILFERLKAHRKGVASSRMLPLYIIADNKLLQQLVMLRPSNQAELLRVRGIGPAKAKDYGAAWLEIIATFKAEMSLKATQSKSGTALAEREPNVGVSTIRSGRRSFDEADDDGPLASKPRDMGTRKYETRRDDKPNDGELKRRKIVNLGRSKEVVLLPSDYPLPLHTGLSFEFSNTTLGPNDEVIVTQSNDQSDSDDESAFGPPMASPTSSALKRKRHPSWSSRPDDQSHQPCMTDASPRPNLTVKQEALAPRPSASSFAELPSSAVLPEPTTPRYAAFAAAAPASSGSVMVPTSQPTPPTQPRLYRDKMILRKKLEAYAKSVMFAMKIKPTKPPLSEETISHLLARMPRTVADFYRVPGIQVMLAACRAVDKDFWRSFAAWTNVPV